MLPQQFKDFAEMLPMLFNGLAVDEDVIKVHEHKLVQVRSKDSIHGSLKRGRGISQPKWQNPPLEQPRGCSESCLWHILICDPDLVIARREVKTREHCRTLQLIKSIIDTRHRIPVLDRLSIQSSVINDHPEDSILLLHKKNGRTIG
jgi:hypothetical protein